MNENPRCGARENYLTSELMRLRGAIGELGKTVEEGRTRLAVVLRPPTPDSPTQEEKVQDSDWPPLVGQIHEITGELRGHLRILQSVLERVELPSEKYMEIRTATESGYNRKG